MPFFHEKIEPFHSGFYAFCMQRCLFERRQEVPGSSVSVNRFLLLSSTGIAISHPVGYPKPNRGNITHSKRNPAFLWSASSV